MAALAVAIAVINYASIAYDAYQFVSDPSWENLGWLALDFVDPSPAPHGAINKGVKHLAEEAGKQAEKKVIQEAAEQGTKQGATEAGRAFKSFTERNFRENLMTLTEKTSDAAKGIEAHHVLPVKHKAKFEKAGININDPKYGAWVKENPEHQKWTYRYNEQWRKFFDDNPDAKPEQIEEFARGLTKDFPFEVNF